METLIETQPRAAGPPKGWRPASARDVALRVLREMPAASLDAQCRRFDELVTQYPRCQFDANTRAFIALARDIKASRTKASNDETRARRAAKERVIRSEVDAIKRGLLDLVMPNGKAMRDCLGSEVASFGRGYQRIAEKVGADQKVGDALTEKQVARLMGGLS
jgi:hypothetical protein